tara:strand:- start:220 stop:480 length:261 start_codon:yes stop_codon:yes gene_type:complete
MNRKRIPQLVPPREIKIRPTKKREELEAEVAEFLRNGGKIDYVTDASRNKGASIKFTLGVKKVPVYEKRGSIVSYSNVKKKGNSTD